MKKALFIALIISFTGAHGAYLTSTIVPAATSVVATVTEKTADAVSWSLTNIVKNISFEAAKLACYDALKRTLTPLGTFIYNNTILSAATAAVVATVAYQTAKLKHKPAYDAESVEEVVVFARKPKRITRDVRG